MPTADQLYDEAVELQQAGKFDEAAAKIEGLLAVEPDFALAHAALSVWYGKMGKPELAVEHAQKVCQLEPEDPFSFMAMSLVCQRAGRTAEAEEAMSKALEKQWAAHRAQE